MDKIAIVTGGAGGMGLATATILGRDHRLVLGDVKQEQLDAAVVQLRDLGIHADGVAGDISDPKSVDALFAHAAAIGQVAAVVHTAGVSPLMGSAETIIRVNAIGTINVTETALSMFGKGSALVNVASSAGHMQPRLLVPKGAYKYALTDRERFVERLVANARRGPRRMHSGSAYSISKNFVIWFSKSRAAAFGAKGARIVSVSPGSFDTEMGRLEVESGAGKLADFSALKRFGRAEEVAEVLAFCASDKPGYLTGTDILVDGGSGAGLTLRGKLSMARGTESRSSSSY